MSAYTKRMSSYEKMECGEASQSCAICLESESPSKDLVDGRWLLMTDECQCVYKVHRQCVDKWLWYGLRGEPACLMCGSKAHVRVYCEDVLYSRYVLGALAIVTVGVVLTGAFAVVFVVLASIDGDRPKS